MTVLQQFEARTWQPACPVCLSAAVRPFVAVGERDYWRCTDCVATWLDPRQLPTPTDEHTHYALHENNPADRRYRAFLSRLAGPLLEVLAPGQHGLDYGCGPGPALACMLREAGHSVELYDPFFAADDDLLRKTYDFITCSEVVEHFHRPAEEFARLDSLLRRGGILAIMTCFQTDDAKFSQWHYRRDPTHVLFYRAETFDSLAARHAWTCEIPAKDIVLLHK